DVPELGPGVRDLPYRKRGAGRHGLGEMVRHPAAADHADYASLLGGPGELVDQVGIAMGRHHTDLVRDPQSLEDRRGLLHDRQVGCRSDQDAHQRRARLRKPWGGDAKDVLKVILKVVAHAAPSIASVAMSFR